MSYGTIDFSEYPIITLRMREGDATVSEIDEFFDTLEAGIDQRDGDIIFKTYGADSPVSGKVRTKVGLRSNQLAQKYGERTLGVILILPGLISRLMLKGILLVMNTPVKMIVVSSEAEADAKIERLLAVPRPR